MSRVVVVGRKPEDYAHAGARLIERLNLPIDDLKSVRVIADAGDVLRVEVVFLASSEDLDDPASD